MEIVILKTFQTLKETYSLPGPDRKGVRLILYPYCQAKDWVFTGVVFFEISLI